MARPNQNVEIIESCENGIQEVIKSEAYLKSIELYSLFYLIPAKDDISGAWKNQACRAASSIGANMCEGVGRATVSGKSQFYRIARGSAYECVHWAMVCPIIETRLETLSKEICSILDIEIIDLTQQVQRLWTTVKNDDDWRNLKG